jgi:hypothetical protein
MAQPDAKSTLTVDQWDWYPSRFGAGDEIGASNLLTPDVTLEAVKLVKNRPDISFGGTD